MITRAVTTSTVKIPTNDERTPTISLRIGLPKSVLEINSSTGGLLLAYTDIVSGLILICSASGVPGVVFVAGVLGGNGSGNHLPFY